jgi:hypothetical protein
MVSLNPRSRRNQLLKKYVTIIVKQLTYFAKSYIHWKLLSSVFSVLPI